jgi:hypothetical protein
MGVDEGFLGRLGPELLTVLPRLDERSRRLVLGMAARAAGDGGTAAVAALAGMAPHTVAKGAAELASGEDPPAGRVRRPGGGRKRLTGSDPGLLPALEGLIRDAMRGDPVSSLLWTTRSADHLAGELTARGHPCSASSVLRTMKRAGYTQQSSSRAQEGRQHPERDAQFRYIAVQAEEHMAAGQPVISVDSKKREKVGNYGQEGAEWGPGGEPVRVRSHDFPDRDGQHAIPYGIYDEQANTGLVNVGTDGNTAALAVESVRRWWAMAGKAAYPDATRLLATCDAGGSSSCVSRAWKAGLAELAAETGLDITACHFPPGTSKWNKIEHRLFCQITLGWRGRPLTSYDVIISTISAVTTKTGLAVTSVLDENDYPAGLEISDARMKDIEERTLTRHEWHGEWNCTLLAVPRPAPEPEPARTSPARLCSRDALSHPALTGASPAEAAALAAALQVPLAARREQRLYRMRKAGRVKAPGAGGPALVSTADALQAALIRRHPGVPAHVIAAVLGVARSTTGNASTEVTQAAAQAGIRLPPPAAPHPARIRTLDDLRAHAAQHGITITAPPPAADTAPQATLTTPARRKITLFRRVANRGLIPSIQAGLSNNCHRDSLPQGGQWSMVTM